MRVYHNGAVVPMDKVTMDLMCSARTQVTDEDPQVPPPVNMDEWRAELYRRTLESLNYEPKGNK